MPLRLPLLLAITLLGGCLPWGDASDWADAPDGVVAWDFILDADSIPAEPPPVDHLVLDWLTPSDATLAALGDAGVQPWCHVSVGLVDKNLEDYDAFAERDDAVQQAGAEPILGEDWGEYDDRRWLDPRRSAEFIDLIEARLQTCADRGFSHVVATELDASSYTTGFELTPDDSVTYAVEVAERANEVGLGFVQTDAHWLSAELEPLSAAVLFESCAVFGDCVSASAPYLDAGKPAFDVEFVNQPWNEEGGGHPPVDGMCRYEDDGLNVILKMRELDARTIVCAAR